MCENNLKKTFYKNNKQNKSKQNKCNIQNLERKIKKKNCKKEKM